MKRSSEATARNREPIADVLRGRLPEQGLVLEVASGAGEHAVHFASLFPGLEWQPTDPDPAALASIRAWREEAELENLREPLQLDAASTEWPVSHADALVCINMVHISPWAATRGLMRSAGRILPAGAPMFLYGPYFRSPLPVAPSNEAFDRSLRARNPEWGLREVDAVVAEARTCGLDLEQLFEMPANNLVLLFRRS